MKKIAVLRCLRVSASCTGSGCLRAMNEKTGAFERNGDEQLQAVAFFTCNGCEENNFLKTLVLLGKYDQIIYWKTAHKRFSELKNYELYVFENSAHLPFWEEFELYKQKVLEFIERE